MQVLNPMLIAWDYPEIHRFSTRLLYAKCSAAGVWNSFTEVHDGGQFIAVDPFSVKVWSCKCFQNPGAMSLLGYLY